MLIRAFEHTVQYRNLYQQSDADRYADDAQQPVEIERCFFIIEPFEQLAAQGKTDGEGKEVQGHHLGFEHRRGDFVDSEREIGDSSSSPIVTASSTNAKMMIGIGVPEEM